MNKELIAKAKRYIDDANRLSAECLKEMMHENGVYVDRWSEEGKVKESKGKEEVYEGHKYFYGLVEEAYWDVKEEDYVETEENVVEFFLNSSIKLKGETETVTHKGVERIEFDDQGLIIRISSAVISSVKRTRLR